MKLFTFFKSLALLLLPAMAFGQGAIKGKLSDESGAPLMYATVQVEGSSRGAVADIDGRYEISGLPAGSYKLKASLIGYEAVRQTVEVKNAAVVVDFTLKRDVLSLKDVVVTGVTNKVSKLESSVSMTTINTATITNQNPSNTAELFRTIPGVRSEASAGEGNTNIAVRGVPISSGGSKYLQLQEDGLPILQFGDIAFATADIFLRADQTIQRIEAIRGGSASTMATNSPAGIINLISKTGGIAGGSVMTSYGLNFDQFRTDFEYGAPLNESVSFHMGGFIRQGEGMRTTGFDANQGGQFKANLTKRFNSGYARVYLKYLNDRTPAYMPMPMQVSGTGTNPVWESVAGYDALRGALQTPFLTNNLGTGVAGDLRTSNLMSGMNPQSTAIGSEFVTEIGEGWSLENRTRMSFNSGRFVAPFPAQFGDPSQIAATIAGAGATLKYTDGTAFGTGNAGNNLLMRMHLFDTELNNFNLFVNDFKLKKNIKGVDLTVGFFRSQQNIDMSWLWNSYLMEVNGNGARMVDVFDSTGAAFSTNGLYAYGTPAWGNLHRSYNTQHTTSSPYAAASWVMADRLFADVSVRYDMGSVYGSFAGGANRPSDVNNDGTVSPWEQSVAYIDHENRTPVAYDYAYLSYSAGLNFKIDEQSAVFGRYSRGGSAKADRILFQNLPYTGGVALNAVDMIDQAELGYKANFKNFALFATAFYAATTEAGGFELTTQRIIDNNYRAFGLELEGAAQFGKLDLRAGATFTNAEISGGADTANWGNMPRRQPGIMYFIAPNYQLLKNLQLGATIIGQTRAYTQDNNKLVMPGYAFVNGYIRYQLNGNISVALNGNNIFNALGITEAEEGSITDNQVNLVRARPITGRTIGFSVAYRF